MNYRIELINGASKVVRSITVSGKDKELVKHYAINELKYTRANCFRIIEL